jgi:hypothetical protein
VCDNVREGWVEKKKVRSEREAARKIGLYMLKTVKTIL